MSLRISARVRAAIDGSSLSWNQAAEAAGMARETLRRRLHNAQPFTVDELEAIATALGRAPDAFLTPATEKQAS